MIMKNRKPIIGLIIIMLLVSVIPGAKPISAISVIQDGITFSETAKYKIPDFSGGYDYFYRQNWDVVVDGVNKGQVALFAPKGEFSNLGRTMMHDNTIYSWGNAFNGNPNYVQAMMSSEKTKINRVSDRQSFYRNYSVDVGMYSGAIVEVAGSAGNGHVKVTTSPYPTISKLQAPTTVKQNQDFPVTFSGMEYDPFSSTLEYIISVNGHQKATGQLSGAKLGAIAPQNGAITNKIENIQLSTLGNMTIELKLYDGIKRPTTKTITVKVETPQTTCKPSLRVEPSIQTVRVGETASYRAIYTDEKCNERDVTDEVDADWSVEDPSIAIPVTE